MQLITKSELPVETNRDEHTREFKLNLIDLNRHQEQVMNIASAELKNN